MKSWVKIHHHFSLTTHLQTNLTTKSLPHKTRNTITHPSLFKPYLPTSELIDNCRIIAVSLFHAVSWTLSQFMSNKAKPLRFSIWLKTCLPCDLGELLFNIFHQDGRKKFRWVFPFIHPCLTCLSCCVSLIMLITLLESDHTYLILIICVVLHQKYSGTKIWIWFFNLSHDDLICCHWVCPAGKVQETCLIFQTYIRVSPDLNLFFHSGLLMLVLLIAQVGNTLMCSCEMIHLKMFPFPPENISYSYFGLI